MLKIQITERKLFFAMIITGIIYFVSQGIILYILSPLGHDVLRFQLTFDRESMEAILNAWGDPGIERFKNHFYIDFLHPLWYGSFIFFTMLFFKTKLAGYQHSDAVPKYVFLPFVAAFLDLAENFMEIGIINSRENLNNTLVMMTGLASLFKWLFALISILIVAALIVQLALQTMKARRG
jgi:hypothetical protein